MRGFKMKSLKNGAPTILTCLASIGVVMTAITAVKATPKAKLLLEEAKEEKGDTLTKLDVVVAVAPAYIPPVVIGASTIACIFGANILNKKAQASLASAYSLVNESYKQYRSKLKELYGEQADVDVRAAIIKDRIAAATPYVTPASGLDDLVDEDKATFYEEYSGKIFEATPMSVQTAEMHLNRNFALGGLVSLNDFFEFLGLPQSNYGDKIGWSMSAGYSYIDFVHRKITLDDGLEVISIQADYGPDEFDECDGYY